MKKNFSFLKSLLVLFVVALFSANASAEDVWKRVMNASELANGDVITFVHEKDPANPYAGGYLYTDYRTEAHEYTGLPEFGGTRFALTSSTQYSGYFILNQVGKENPNQLYQDGTLFNTGDSKEGVWAFDFAAGEDVALMHTANVGNNFIWNESAKCFVSSTADGKVAIYKKVAAAAPTYSTPYALRVKLGDSSKTITASTTTADAKVWYALDAKTFVEGAQNTSVDVLGETVAAAFDKKATTVTAYTQIGYGQTSKTSQVYNLYRLDDATIEIANDSRVGKDGVLNVSASAAGASANVVKIVEIDGVAADVTLATTGTAAAPVADVAQYIGKTIKVKATFTRAELQGEEAVAEGTYTIKPYSDAIISYTADPVDGSKIIAGQLITLTASVSEKATDYIFSNDAVAELEWTNGTKSVKSPAKLEGNKVTTKVPAELRGDGVNANWTLKVPAGLFIADTKNYTVNKITSAEGAFKYAPDYANIAFSINPEEKEFVTDGTTALSFDVAVYPSGAIEGKETITVDPTKVRVTDSQNKNLTASGVTVTDKGNGKYTVEFPVDVIKDYISNKTNKIDLMFSIEKGQIKCTSDESKAGVDYTTNDADVVAYVRFYESVDIQLAASVETVKFCTKHDLPTVKFDITAKGKANAENTYTVSLAEGAKATITGTDANGAAVNVAAEIAVSANKATVTIPATLNGRGAENYTISVPEKAFYVQTGTLEESRSFSAAKAYEKVLDARAHSTFAAKTVNAKYEPNTTFQVEVTATPENGKIIDALAYAMSADSKSVTLSNGTKGTVSFVATEEGKGTATITTDALVPVGTYTVTFDDAAFTVDCDKNKGLTCQLVVEEVVWSLDKQTYEITDETTEFDVKIAATFDGKAIDIDDAPATLTGKIGGTAVSLAKGNVNADKSVTYTVTTAVLAAAGNDAKVYDLVIDKDQLTAQTRKNNDLNAKVSVYSVVKYELATQSVTDIDTKTKEYTFEIVMKDKNGVVLTRDLLKNLSWTGDDKCPEHTIAFNSGFNSNYPTVAFTADANGQKRMIYTTFENLKQGNYQFNIPVGTLYANANANENKMYVNFSVKNHIALSWAEDITKNVDVLGDLAEDKLSYVGPTQNIDTNAKTITVNVKGWDVEVGSDATNLINLVGKFQFDGKDVEAAKTANAGEYIVTLPALTAGTYKLTLAEKALKASNSTNKAMTLDVVVLDAVEFAAQDVTTSYMSKTFNVKVTDTDAAVKIQTGATATLAGQNGLADITVTLADCTTNGYVTVNAESPLQQGEYKLTINAGAMKANNTVQSAATSCKVTVNRNIEFVDNKTVFTKQSDVNAATYDQVTYKRNFTGNWETLAVPFAITAEQAAANGWEIYRINTVAYDVVDSETGNKKNSVFVTKVENATTPNMPYLIKGNASKSEYIFNNLAVVKPETKTLEFTSTSRTFTLKTVAGDAKQEFTDFWYCPDGAFKHYAKANIYPYRWIMTVGVESLYADEMHNEFDIEIGDGSSTGIENVNADENEDIFNLSGQKMNSIQKGINIVNGRKFIVK